MNSADGENLLEAEGGKLQRVVFGTAGVDLVDCDQDRLAAVAQARCGFTIKRYNAFLHVHHEDDDVSSFNCQFDLFEGGARNDVIRLLSAQQPDAPGIDQGKRASIPFGFGANSIPGYAGLVMNNGNAAAHHAIEQRGLTDVRATNNGNQTWHENRMRHGKEI